MHIIHEWHSLFVFVSFLSEGWDSFYSIADSAAEEAGLQIGDIVLAVNGTDVTSMPHSEAANLARKGKVIYIVSRHFLSTPWD